MFAALHRLLLLPLGTTNPAGSQEATLVWVG